MSRVLTIYSSTKCDIGGNRFGSQPFNTDRMLLSTPQINGDMGDDGRSARSTLTLPEWFPDRDLVGVRENFTFPVKPVTRPGGGSSTQLLTKG